MAFCWLSAQLLSRNMQEQPSSRRWLCVVVQGPPRWGMGPKLCHSGCHVCMPQRSTAHSQPALLPAHRFCKHAISNMCLYVLICRG